MNHHLPDLYSLRLLLRVAQKAARKRFDLLMCASGVRRLKFAWAISQAAASSTGSQAVCLRECFSDLASSTCELIIIIFFAAPRIWRIRVRAPGGVQFESLSAQLSAPEMEHLKQKVSKQ